MLVQIHQEVDSWCIHDRGAETPRCIRHRGVIYEYE